MNFLNLGLGELLGMVGVVSAGVVALYLFDRSKRKQLVSTLRFWINADVRTELKHRRRIQQPWSLLLQLLSLALLLIAIAGPQLGVFDTTGRDHVIVLDTSAWMGSRVGRGTLMDQAKADARAYMKSVPLRDRVMIVRADALATPATGFETDRGKVDGAIQDSQPTASALNLSQALTFAEHAQQQQSKKPGEIVLISAGRVAEEEAALTTVPANLRVIEAGSNQENLGLRKVGMRRSPDQPDTWDIFVAVHNYGTRPHNADLELQFAKSPAGTKRLSLPPGGEEQATFHYQEKSGGSLQARLNNERDAFPQDDRVTLEVPPQASTKAVVYTNEPNLLRALFASDPQVETEFEPTNKYDANVKADVVVLDRFIPPSSPRGNTIWIEPPAVGSPIPVRSTLNGVALDKWHTDTALGAGLRTRDVALETAEILTPGSGDMVVAEASAGPVIVARKGEPKYVVIGFHPGKGSIRNELATPLLIANTIRWMAPATYRQWEVQAGTVGTVSVPVEKGTNAAGIKVLDASDRALPFTIEDDTLRFFSGAPGTVRVQMGDREVVYSLTLPDVAEAAWNVPATVKKGIPKPTVADAVPTNLWPWLAVLGGLGLLADWLLYGRSRALKLRVSNAMPWRKAA